MEALRREGSCRVPLGRGILCSRYGILRLRSRRGRELLAGRVSGALLGRLRRNGRAWELLVPLLLANEPNAQPLRLLGWQWQGAAHGWLCRLQLSLVDNLGVVEIVIVEAVLVGRSLAGGGYLRLGLFLRLRELERIVLDLLQNGVVEVVEPVVRKLIHGRRLLCALPHIAMPSGGKLHGGGLSARVTVATMMAGGNLRGIEFCRNRPSGSRLRHRCWAVGRCFAPRLAVASDALSPSGLRRAGKGPQPSPRNSGFAAPPRGLGLALLR